MNTINYLCKRTTELLVVLTLLIASGSCIAGTNISADQVFSVLQNTTYQIRIVEEKSDSQAALGTGFLISEDRIATNYHVVSNNVLEPEKYRVEIELSGKIYALKVLTVDIVHDLAILQVNEQKKGPLAEVQNQEMGFGEPFILSQSAPKNGEVLYSLGNPHDLGLTIVEGNYNGLVENKFIDRIHFSGAINSGMSGGPTVNSDFEVVGINVATGGNQVGFLVPVDYLSKLLTQSHSLPADYDLLVDMARQIDLSTDAMIEELLNSEWPSETMGTATVLGNEVDWLTCWGNSKDDKEKGILNISRGCNNGDNIYINSHFTSGFLEYEYSYFEALEWPVAAFYRHLRAATGKASGGNRANKEDVENYDCTDKILHTQSTSSPPTHMTRRVSYCSRPYKRLTGLYDVFFLGISQDKSHKAVMDHFTISGVSKDSSMKFLARFVEVLGWE